MAQLQRRRKFVSIFGWLALVAASSTLAARRGAALEPCLGDQVETRTMTVTSVSVDGVDVPVTREITSALDVATYLGDATVKSVAVGLYEPALDRVISETGQVLP